MWQTPSHHVPGFEYTAVACQSAMKLACFYYKVLRLICNLCHTVLERIEGGNDMIC